MDVLDHSLHFCEQTKTAINAARNGDWELSQSIINDRDQHLKKELSIDFSQLPDETQQKLYSNLKILEQLNTELVEFVMASKKDVTDQKSSLAKNKNAINQYLDNALK